METMRVQIIFNTAVARVVSLPMIVMSLKCSISTVCCQWPVPNPRQLSKAIQTSAAVYIYGQWLAHTNTIHHVNYVAKGASFELKWRVRSYMTGM